MSNETTSFESLQCALIQHEPRFEPAEFATLRDSIASMITALDDAAHTSADPGAPPPVIVSNVAHNGQRGRPRHEIDPDFLREALTMGTLADIARSTGQSVRTVRRRALELGLVQPGVAPICHQTEADGSVSQVHQNQLQDFPNFGRRMLKGWLSSIGHEVPRSRIEASCLRIRGPPGLFGGRAPRRREYHVLGANSPMLISHRPHSLQIRHTLLHRRQITIRCRCWRPRQQPCCNRPRPLPPVHRAVRDAESGPGRPWYGELTRRGVHGTSQRRRPRVIHDETIGAFTTPE